MNKQEHKSSSPQQDPKRSSPSSSPVTSTADRTVLSHYKPTWWGRIRNLLDIRLLVLVISTMIVILILLLTSWLKPNHTSSTELSWGELEPFRFYQSEQVHNQSLVSAIEHNYMQQVDKSAEQNGYRLTINAVTADENRLILMYTAHTDRDRYIPGVNSVKLRNIATGQPLSMASARLNGIQDENNPQQYYGTATIRLDQKQNFPREIAAQFQIMSTDNNADQSSEAAAQSIHYSPTLLVHFSLAPQFQRQETEIIYPNRAVEWSSHKLTMSRVEISPLEMRVRFTSDTPVDEKDARPLWLKPENIISEKNGTAVNLLPTGSRLISCDPYTFEHVFYSNLLNEPDSLQLVVKPRDASAYEDVRIIKIK
ncbi:DUF4179 domain-containing protein [Paenibacillus sp. WLX1005]|uniref:DUF4179 domain-containing protein n=1 Tax=Paenibacillus sp. WLX1005 TaxID=3243766 RepID=UPI003984080F